MVIALTDRMVNIVYNYKLYFDSALVDHMISIFCSGLTITSVIIWFLMNNFCVVSVVIVK